jgi:hypothetical protein
MTQQYLVGELSELLGRFQVVAVDCGEWRASLVRLRWEAESAAPEALAQVVRQALALVDVVSGDALERGDLIAFFRIADVGTALREFGGCAGLLDGS